MAGIDLWILGLRVPKMKIGNASIFKKLKTKDIRKQKGVTIFGKGSR
ncbi:MAG: hypothetical protein H7A33_02735 [Deltaproteobacteria bacterium]|nr:hypothetical protein [Deltaproteobacteria bacterium]